VELDDLLGHLVGADRAFVDVDLGQRVDDAGGLPDVLLRRFAHLPRLDVDDLDALAEVGEADATRPHDEVVGRVAGGEHQRRGRAAHRGLDHVRRDTDDAALFVDLTARAAEEGAGFAVLDEDAGLGQDLERRLVDVDEVVLGEHVETEGAEPTPPGLGIASHLSSPGVRGTRSRSRPRRKGAAAACDGVLSPGRGGLHRARNGRWG